MSNSAGAWTTHSVGGHPCDVYEPAGRNEYTYVVVYLHSIRVETLREQPSFVAQFDRFGLPVVCPVTQQSWWADRICRAFDRHISAQQHIFDAVLPFIEECLGSKPPRIGLLGTGMGGQGALRMSYRCPNVFPVVAAISPAIEYYRLVAEGDPTLVEMYGDAEAARQDTAILHVHPLNWPRHQFFCCDPADHLWFDSSDRLRMKLSSLGIPHECDLETSADGHGSAYFNLMAEPAVSFIAERLERERLRVE